MNEIKDSLAPSDKAPDLLDVIENPKGRLYEIQRRLVGKEAARIYFAIRAEKRWHKNHARIPESEIPSSGVWDASRNDWNDPRLQ